MLEHFLHISLLSLHNNDMKFPYAMILWWIEDMMHFSFFL